MRSLIIGAALAASISSVSTAAIVTTTYEGTVEVGEDTAGLLGAAGADLSGLSFVAIFVLDTSINRFTPGPGGEDDAVFGPDYPGSIGNPFLSASVTLSGTPFNLALHGQNYAYLAPLTISHSSSIFASDYWDFLAQAVGIPSNLDAPFSVMANQDSYGDVAFSDGAGGYSLYFRGGLTHASSTVAGVPEPATWSLMILGFMGAGAALRDRRRSQRPPSLAAD